MKKLVFATFVGFWASVATIAALQAMSPAETGDNNDGAAGDATFTLAQVAEHATLDDCWMAIEGVVYDFTAYIPEHPTPVFIMEQWCGREATEGMRTKGYGRDHSPAAWAMMEAYRVGTLVDED